MSGSWSRPPPLRSFSRQTGQRSRGPATDPGLRIHEDAETDAMLEGLNAPGAALGQDIYLSSDLDDMARATVLAHEATHVRQSGNRPTTGTPKLTGPVASEERQANIAARLKAPVAPQSGTSDPNTVRLYDEGLLLSGSITQAWASALTDAELEMAIEAVRVQIDSLAEGSDLRGVAMSNLSILESTVMDRGANVELDPPKPVSLSLNDKRPWVIEVHDSDATPRDIAYELYGVDISPVMPRETELVASAVDAVARFAGYDFGIDTQGSYTIVQDMLVPKYLEIFHTKMEAQLSADLARTRKILLYETTDSDERDELEKLNRRWSRRGNLRARDGGSYFDAYLRDLNSRHIVRDWGLFETSRRSYLTELYDVLGNPFEDRSGDLTRRIAQNSQEFGAHVPYWELNEADGALPGEPNEVLVKRTANLILDRIEGTTWPSQSEAIVTMMRGLPPGVQQAVLKKVMDAHDDTIAWGALGRFGEPTGDHMIYNLFESLEDDDAEELADTLKASGLISEDGAEAFVAGRSWAGRNLPWTTYYGAEAQKYWQNEYDQGGSRLNLLGAGFAGLWTPDTASETILMLTTARLGLPLVSKAPGFVQKGLLYGGAALGGYSATTALLEASLGHTKDGKPLNEGQRVTRAIQGLMELAFLAETAHIAGKLDDPGSALVRQSDDALLPPHAIDPDVLPVRSALPKPKGGSADITLSGSGGSGSGAGVRIVNVKDDGTVLAVARAANGEHAIISINAKTGNGTILFPEQGVYPIEGFQFAAPRKALGPARPELPPASNPNEPDFDAILGKIDTMGPDDLTTTGMFQDVFFYGQTSQIRASINAQRQAAGLPPLRGRPARTPRGQDVNPNPGHQGAHVTPQSTVRNMPDVDPADLVARLLPTGKGHTHTVFDQHWQAAFRRIRARDGRTTTSAGEVFEVVSDAMRNSGAFSAAEAETFSQLLASELFVTRGLDLDTVMRMPGT